MSRIERALRDRKEAGGYGLIPFLTAGDPDPAETPRLIAAMAEAGGDVIELGVPFSDPLADGPAIQRASERALARGVTLHGVIGIVRETRALTRVPIVLFGYFNSFLAYGTDRLVRTGIGAGIDGVLIVDLPFDEEEELSSALRRSGLDTVQLVSPTTGRERIAGIAGASRGFVYCVSRTGVTGARGEAPAGLEERIASIRQASDLPVAVGFGISSPAQARAAGTCADAVVVGSALIEAIAGADTTSTRLAAAAQFVSSLKSGSGDSAHRRG